MLERFDLQGFGVNLRLTRLDRGLSQGQLARHLGVGQSWISDLECGRQRGLAAATVFRLALALDTSADYLLGLDALSEAQATASCAVDAAWKKSYASP